MMVEVAAELRSHVECMRFEPVRDERGALWPVAFAALPIRPVRAFVVEAPEGAVRGGHAHAAGGQLLICINGRIDIEISLQAASQTFPLGAGGEALLIRSPAWARQIYRAQDARLLVLCDTPYYPESYIWAR